MQVNRPVRKAVSDFVGECGKFIILDTSCEMFYAREICLFVLDNRLVLLYTSLNCFVLVAFVTREFYVIIIFLVQATGEGGLSQIFIECLGFEPLFT